VADQADQTDRADQPGQPQPQPVPTWLLDHVLYSDRIHEQATQLAVQLTHRW